MRQIPALSVTLVLSLLALFTLLAGPVLPAAGAAGTVGSAGASGCAREAEDAVRALLATQSAAWNRGDLEAFTAVYAEDAAFLSPTGLTRGRGQVLARYRKRYPDKKAMGTLSLDVVEGRLFESTGTAGGGCQVPGASVAARWKLDDAGQPGKKIAEGLTLLVLRHRGTTWEIVEDASM
jgi:ketosteroid isomerase-like protein